MLSCMYSCTHPCTHTCIHIHTTYTLVLMPSSRIHVSKTHQGYHISTHQGYKRIIKDIIYKKDITTPTCTNTHTHAHTHIYTHTHTHTYTHTRTHTRIYTHTHTHTHMLAHTHIHTHAHVQIRSLTGPSSAVRKYVVLTLHYLIRQITWTLHQFHNTGP
jgi:hypothetical protein